MSLEALDKNNSKTTIDRSEFPKREKVEARILELEALKRFFESILGPTEAIFTAVETDNKALFEYVELNSTQPTEMELSSRISKTIRRGGDNLIRTLDRLYNYGKRLGYPVGLQYIDPWGSLEALQWLHGKGVVITKKLINQWLRDIDISKHYVDRSKLIGWGVGACLENKWDEELFLKCLPYIDNFQIATKCLTQCNSTDKLNYIMLWLADHLTQGTLEEVSQAISVPVSTLLHRKFMGKTWLAGLYPIHGFLSFKDPSIAISLLQKYPELLDQKTEKDENLLEFSVKHARCKAVQYIASTIAEPTKLTFTTPLVHALIDGATQRNEKDDLLILRYLIHSLHVDPNQKDNKGNAPLHHLIEKMHGRCTLQPDFLYAIFSILIALGAKPWLKDARGRTAFALALQNPTAKTFRHPLFPQSMILEYYRTLPVPNEQLPAHYSNMINTIVSNAHHEEVNYLELALLLGEPAIATSFRLKNTRECFDKHLQRLRDSHPIAYSETFLYQAGGVVNTKIPLEVKRIPPSKEELSFNIDKFLAFFDGCAPAKYKADRSILERLLYLTKNRLPKPLIDVQHGSISPQEAEKYYTEFEDRLKHIGFHYQNDPKRLTTFFSRLIPTFSSCPEAPMSIVRDECNEIDDRLGLSSDSGLKEQFCSSLRAFFKTCVDQLANKIDPAQSRHASHYILKTIGKDLQLSNVEISYTDVHSLLYGKKFPKSTLLFLFHTHFCTPFALIDHVIAFFDPLNPTHSKHLGAYMREFGKNFAMKKYEKIRTALKNETSPACLKAYGIPYHEDKGIIGSIDEAQQSDYLENRAFTEDLHLSPLGAFDLLVNLGILYMPQEAPFSQ